ARVVRRVRGTEGEGGGVQELQTRVGCGLAAPWVRRGEDTAGEKVLIAIAGGDGSALHGPALTAGEHRSHHGSHHLTAGQETSWVMTWFPSWLEVPPVGAARPALERTCAEWTD